MIRPWTNASLLLFELLAACALCAGGCSSPKPTTLAPKNAHSAFPDVPDGETVVRAPDGSAEATYRYRLVLPRPESIADPGTKVPLIVFMHGSGERGDDNESQLKHFAGWCAGKEMQLAHPCYVLAMQCPAGETWAALDLKAYREEGATPVQSKEPTRAMRALMQAVDEVAAARAVDRTRIYLTGLSMGGFGAFDLAARRPSLFAAVVPVCGGGDPRTAETIARIPFCIVHGSDDPVVPVGLSRLMRDAIARAASDAREAGARAGGRPSGDANPRYREYDHVGHDSWTPAYRLGPDGVLDWMFVQKAGSDVEK